MSTIMMISMIMTTMMMVTRNFTMSTIMMISKIMTAMMMVKRNFTMIIVSRIVMIMMRISIFNKMRSKLIMRYTMPVRVQRLTHHHDLS